MTCQPSIERFYWSTLDDILAITHDGSVAQPLFPKGIESLADTPIKNQVGVMMKLRDAEGNVVGLGSELEWLTDDGKLVVHFTITIPGRGVLVAHQIKEYAHPALLSVFGKVQESGEPWTGDMAVVATCGPSERGMGVIIAGTGEFAGAKGTMKQTMNFKRIAAEGATAVNEEVYFIESVDPDRTTPELDETLMEAAQIVEVDTSFDATSRAYRAFDTALNQGIRDGGAIMVELAAAGKVAWATGSTPFGDWMLPSVFKLPDDLPLAMVFSYDAVTTCLRDAETFKHKMYPDIGGQTFLHMDGPEHRRYRLLLGEVFSPGACKRWDELVVGPLIKRMIGDILAKSEKKAELRAELCDALPSYVFGAIMDVPADDFEKLKAWAYYVIAAPIDPESAQQVASLGVYLGTLVAQRRALGGDELAKRTDLVSAMIRAHHPDYGSLTDEEIVSALFILTAAGNETTGRGLSTTLYYLLSNPEALEEVLADRSLLAAAQQEALRLSPAGGCFELRLATKDATLDGEPISEGVGVVTNLYTANRDASRWERPDEFDIHRKHAQTVAFGYGPHMCLGMHLARTEISTGLNALLDRLPNLRFDPNAPTPQIEGMWFPGAPALPVIWD
jgi:cytochrome P450